MPKNTRESRIITYLQMLNPDQSQPSRLPAENASLIRIDPPDPELNQRLYRQVGEAWQWTDRAGWSLSDWQQLFEKKHIETLVFSLQGIEAGYAELELQANRDIEIAYFGLLADFIGRGLGGFFLSRTVETAWSLNPQRLWLHTCNLDHPQALNNYIARGFRIYKEEITVYRTSHSQGGDNS